ncbi:hypothetical protein AMTRI_Chr04g185430 [Amborella trichopoda]
MGHVSNIKLIRTNTTLDLSQKAEKGILLTSCYLINRIPSSILDGKSQLFPSKPLFIVPLFLGVFALLRS